MVFVPYRPMKTKPKLEVEVMGYMPPNREDHADSPSRIRDLLNASAARPASSRSEHFDPETNGFTASYKLPSTPIPITSLGSASKLNPKDGQRYSPRDTKAVNSKNYHRQDEDDHEDMSAYEQDEFGYLNDPDRGTNPTSILPAEPMVRDDSMAALEEYAWSPTQSEDSFSNLTALDVIHANSHPEPFNLMEGLHNKQTENERDVSPASGSGYTMDFVNYADATSIVSLQSSPGFFVPSGAPYLDVPILADAIEAGSHSEPLSASQHEPSTESRQSSYMAFSRFSGIISNRSSERFMNHDEIGESLLVFEKSGRMVDSEARPPSFAKSNNIMPSQLDSRGRNIQFDRDDLFVSHKKAITAINGPGSSQTSSSLSRGGFGGEMVGGTLRVCSDHDDPHTMRSPTPNPLFGRLAMKAPDSDWETVSDLRGSENNVVGKSLSEAQTGSSLADISDLSEIPFIKQSAPRHPITTPRRTLGQSTQPRPNQTFILVKNDQTGRIDCLPQHHFEERGRAFNSVPGTALASANTTNVEYYHPTPLSTVHTHPFLSPPPAIRLTRNITASFADAPSPSQQQAATNTSSSSEPSSDAVMAANIDDQSVWEDVTEGGHATNESLEDEEKEQRGSGRDEKVRSIHSSAWLSTVSEGESGDYSLPDHGHRVGSFAKVTVLGSKGNITGTPEGTGAREVGSSIADASSQGAKFSSPATFGSSPFSPPQQDIVDDSTSQHSHNYVKTLNNPFATTLKQDPPVYDNTFSKTPQYAHSYQSASGNPFATPKTSPTSSTGPGEMRFPYPPIDAVSIEMHERGYRASRKIRGQRKTSPQSSSESEARIKASPITQKASGVPSPVIMGHRHRKTATGLLLRESSTHSDSEISRDGSADAAPAFDYLASAYNVRPWDSVSAHSRPTPRPGTYVRPIARAESPHLYHIPRQPAPEVVARQEQISFWVLVTTCIVPPIALLYGYGLMDGIISQLTSGEINQYDEWHKFFAKCWGFGMTGVIILAIVIAMLIISA